MEQKQENPFRGGPRKIKQNPWDTILGGNKVGTDLKQVVRLLTACYVVSRNQQPPVLKTAVQEDYGTERQQGGIEPEDVFTLRNGDFVLVEARGGTDSARSCDETAESATTNALMILWRVMQNPESSRRYYLLVVATRRSKSLRRP